MKTIRPIAMYLPQFHRVKENDEWWGEGFTEWTAVKRAEKYGPEQEQPRRPFMDYYYDLMEKSTMQWQAGLANKYGVGGFCFYHYYFGDKKILEKPAENLIEWKEIDMPFCFCWANGSWARTWSNLSDANTWADKFEQTEDGKAILLEQKYGEREDWIKHLSYLQDFFSDSRYIRKDGRPVFLIYETDKIPCLADMITCWKSESIKQGNPIPYIIGVNCEKLHNCLDAVLLPGPRGYYATAKKDFANGVLTFDYQEVCEKAVAAPQLGSIKTYWGTFVDYDDTPRRGKKGWFFKNQSVLAFKKQVEDLAVKNMANDNEFLFINAWNEWGEGNYLEPDETNGYAYLETVRDVMKMVNDSNFDLETAYRPIKKKMQKDVVDIRYEENLYFTLSKNDYKADTEIDFKDAVIVMYLYYEDLIEQYLSYILNISSDIKVIVISSSDNLLTLVKEKLAARGNFETILKDNRGRDISALLISAKKYFDKYKYLCFVHDKKSSYLKSDSKDIDRWARSLVDNMISTNCFVENVIRLLESREDIGLLLPPEPLGDTWNLWMNNTWADDFDIEQELIEKLDLNVEIYKDKPSFSLGTTFWCRTEALKKLVDYPWKYEDFPSEPMPVDGTISHAIERGLPYVAQDAGFKSGMLMTDEYAAWQFAFVQNRIQKLNKEIEEKRMLEPSRDSGEFFRSIENLIDYCEGKTHIYIYGAGVVGQRAKSILEKFGYEVSDFIVTKKDDKPETIELDEYLSQGKEGDGIIIAVTDTYKFEILDLLKEKGVDNYYLY